MTLWRGRVSCPSTVIQKYNLLHIIAGRPVHGVHISAGTVREVREPQLLSGAELIY